MVVDTCYERLFLCTFAGEEGASLERRSEGVTPQEEGERGRGGKSEGAEVEKGFYFCSIARLILCGLEAVD